MALKCGNYTEIDKLYYLEPHKTLDDGLVGVYNDTEVLQMANILLKCRTLDLYVMHGVNVPESMGKLPDIIFEGHHVACVSENKQALISSRKKLTPRRSQSIANVQVGPTSPKQKAPFKKAKESIVNTPPTKVQESKAKSLPETVVPPPSNSSPRFSKVKEKEKEDELPHDYHVFYDERPDSPIPFHELVSEPESDSTEDYQPLSDDAYSEVDAATFDDELVINEEEYEELEVDAPTFDDETVINEEEDEELEENTYADSTDEELRETRDSVRRRKKQLLDVALELQKQAEKGNICVDGEEEIQTPTDSDEEEVTRRSRKSRGLVVSEGEELLFHNKKYEQAPKNGGWMSTRMSTQIAWFMGQ
ncbi:Respiration factor 2 [Bienertia sinuspersici]